MDLFRSEYGLQGAVGFISCQDPRKQAVCECNSLTVAVWIGFWFATVTPKQFNLAAFF